MFIVRTSFITVLILVTILIESLVSVSLKYQSYICTIGPVVDWTVYSLVFFDYITGHSDNKNNSLCYVRVYVVVRMCHDTLSSLYYVWCNPGSPR